MADQKVVSSATSTLKDAVQTPSTSSSPASQKADGAVSSPDYTPAVGDVVEFEHHGLSYVGIVFKSETYANQLALTHHTKSQYCYFSYFKNHNKIGHTDTMPSCDLTCNKANAIAKAYFSKKASTSQFKVGDRVKVVSGLDGGHDVGTAGVVSQDSSQSSLGIKSHGTVKWHAANNLELVTAPTFTADPSKSYKERQKQAVKHYGWKKGSKVKVSQSYGQNEDGFEGYASDSNAIKRTFMQSEGVANIDSIQKGRIVIDIGSYTIAAPYFALEPA